MANKIIDIDAIVKALDITPSMYQNAVDKYKAIANELKTRGIDADFYPQGSFRLGTVTRPLKDGKDTDYDLDVICEISTSKEKVSPKEVKISVGQALKENRTYNDKLLPEDDRCWTLKYALVDGPIGFSLDIVPSVHQDDISIRNVLGKNVRPEYADKAIAITDRITNEAYQWVPSNPKGYALWFDEINAKFLAYNRQDRRQAIYSENRKYFASVEDVPEGVERSALQRVVQILKRHRDLYYTRARAWDKKPNSAIVTTLSAQIALHAPDRYSTYELLEFVSNDLEQYALLLNGKSAGFYSNYEMRSYIKKEDQKWRIFNPVDPNDNYADAWDDDTAKLFFKWAAAVKQDFIDISEQTEDRYYAGLKNGIGSTIVEMAIPASIRKTPATTFSGTKPWRCK